MSGRCTVCGSTAGSARAQENGYTLLQCDCGAMFLDHAPPEGFVDPRFDPHPPAFYANAAALRLDWVRRHAPAARDFVEVGSGEGHLLAAAQRMGYAVAGIECAAERAAAAQARLGVPVEAALVEESRRPDASCDIVYHCDLLSHFPDPPAALARMRAMLRPGGMMAFEVGLVGGLADHWYRVGALQLPHHRWFYSAASLERLLADAGFEMVARKRFGMGLNFRLSQLAGRLGVGGGATRPKRFVAAEGAYRDARTGRREDGTAPPGLAARLRARAYAFVRYQLGAMTPGYGPGTAFFIVRPV